VLLAEARAAGVTELRITSGWRPMLGSIAHRAGLGLDIDYAESATEHVALNRAALAVDRVERALALFMVVAWRIAYLMRLGRTCPDLDATLLFSADEIGGTYLLSKLPKPKQPPRLNEVVTLFALLGGFLGRKSDGEPGVKTIWRGLDQVMTAAQTRKALREEGD
jgi:hypothetical protein